MSQQHLNQYDCDCGEVWSLRSSKNSPDTCAGCGKTQRPHTMVQLADVLEPIVAARAIEACKSHDKLRLLVRELLEAHGRSDLSSMSYSDAWIIVAHTENNVLADLLLQAAVQRVKIAKGILPELTHT